MCDREKIANCCLTATAMTKRANFPFLCLFLLCRGFVVDVSTPGRKPCWYVYFHLELLASPRTLNNTQTQTKPNNVCFFFLHMKRKDNLAGSSACDGNSVCVSMLEEERGPFIPDLLLSCGGGLLGYFLMQSTVVVKVNIYVAKAYLMLSRAEIPNSSKMYV